MMCIFTSVCLEVGGGCLKMFDREEGEGGVVMTGDENNNFFVSSIEIAFFSKNNGIGIGIDFPSDRHTVGESKYSFKFAPA